MAKSVKTHVTQNPFPHSEKFNCISFYIERHRPKKSVKLDKAFQNQADGARHLLVTELNARDLVLFLSCEIILLFLRFSHPVLSVIFPLDDEQLFLHSLKKGEKKKRKNVSSFLLAHPVPINVATPPGKTGQCLNKGFLAQSFNSFLISLSANYSYKAFRQVKVYVPNLPRQKPSIATVKCFIVSIWWVAQAIR